jgi:GGDEF domain-containing protein
MTWDEDPHGHADDFDSQRQSHSGSPHTPPSSAPMWDITDAENANAFSKRLDHLLPLDGDTGVTTHQATCVYIDAMIEMVSRNEQTLSLLSIAVDESHILRFLGAEGAALIGRAVARCLWQETRTHDVVGHADPEMAPDAFTFLVACPLLSEEKAGRLGERLRAAMTAHCGDANGPWLTLSVGVASLSLDVIDSRSLVARSLEALRRARRAGGSRVWRHTDTRRVLMENCELLELSDPLEQWEVTDMPEASDGEGEA